MLSKLRVINRSHSTRHSHCRWLLYYYTYLSMVRILSFCTTTTVVLLLLLSAVHQFVSIDTPLHIMKLSTRPKKCSQAHGVVAPVNGILMGHEHVGAAHNSTQIHTIVDNSNLSPKNDQGAMMTMRYVAKELRGPGYTRSTAHRSLRLTPLYLLRYKSLIRTCHANVKHRRRE